MSDTAEPTLYQWIMGGLMAALGAVTGWLARSVVSNRERLAVLEAKALTSDGVRAAIKESLDARDRIAEERRREWDRRHSLEIKEAVREQVDAMEPRLMRAIRDAVRDEDR